VELLSITAKNFFCFVDIGGIVDPKEIFSSDGQQFLQYQQNKRKFKQ
jgi:hypothetical protein